MNGAGSLRRTMKRAGSRPLVALSESCVVHADSDVAPACGSVIVEDGDDRFGVADQLIRLATAGDKDAVTSFRTEGRRHSSRQSCRYIVESHAEHLVGLVGEVAEHGHRQHRRGLAGQKLEYTLCRLIVGPGYRTAVFCGVGDGEVLL